MADTTKTAIIIGASRGLGAGLARELAARGWQVTATARGDAPELAAAVAVSEGRITTATVDIDDDASIAALAATLVGRHFDLVFVNAGVSGPRHGDPMRVTPAEMGALLHTNAVAPIRVAAALLPMLVDGGTLAFMSSKLGSVGDNSAGGFDLYRASKASLNTLTRSFYATTLKAKGLSVLTLHPGWVRTAMGGPQATLSVEESVTGLADVIAAAQPGHRYLDYAGAELPW